MVNKCKRFFESAKLFFGQRGFPVYERAVLQDELECSLPGEGIDADKKKPFRLCAERPGTVALFF